jgi:porphobilinogen synthase
MSFPTTRLRRLRQSEPLRSLVRETRLAPTNFIYPLFVCPGEGVRKAISSMAGVFNLSVDEAVKEAREAKSLGLGGIILFGLPEKKDEVATGAWAEDGIVQRATRAIKREVRDLVVIGDVCLCEYTSHGHCGIVEQKRPAGTAAMRVVSTTRGQLASVATKLAEAATAAEYEIVNDTSLEILAKTAVSLTRAGMDVIAPSDMMDGRVAAIRKALDENGFSNTPILSYAAKFASSFYGPFREAADSVPQFGDRRSYQMDGANLHEAMREIALDIQEGADIILVKPAMPYLDVIAEARRRFDVPIAAYQVSGEYSMLQAAIAKGWLDGRQVVLESLQSIRRAGAQIILTYFAKEAARLLN